MQNMFVYYDISGDIKSISPVEDTTLTSEFNVASVPLDDVRHLLVGTVNPASFMVKQIKTNDVIIIKKPSIIEQRIRYINPFFIELTHNNSALLFVRLDTKLNVIHISLNDDFFNILKNRDNEKYDTFLGFSNIEALHLYFTKKNDPTMLLQMITFSPKQLVKEKSITVEYAGNLNNCSLFVKRILDSYSYKEE